MRFIKEFHDVLLAELSVCICKTNEIAALSIFGSEPESKEGGPTILTLGQKTSPLLSRSLSLALFTLLLLSFLRNVTSANGLENGPARHIAVSWKKGPS